jgi:hypothetical protein
LDGRGRNAKANCGAWVDLGLCTEKAIETVGAATALGTNRRASAGAADLRARGTLG